MSVIYTQNINIQAIKTYLAIESFQSYWTKAVILKLFASVRVICREYIDSLQQTILAKFCACESDGINWQKCVYKINKKLWKLDANQNVKLYMPGSQYLLSKM